MYFSGKVTHSLLSYLMRHQHVDTTVLQEMVGLPWEFACDPSSWLEASKVEQCLATLDSEFGRQESQETLTEAAGHAAPDLRSWGALDSVLRMMQKPQDVFTQPQRFISYFISPEPPIGNLRRSSKSVSFDLPLSDFEYPFVTSYLRAALEALPTFMGQEMARANWKDSRLTVEWETAQASFFNPDERGHNIQPEFMQALMNSLETAQKALEEKQKDLTEKEGELGRLREENDRLKVALFHSGEVDRQAQNEWRIQMIQAAEAPFQRARSQVLKLSDYLARAQQLVVLLSGQRRMDPQVREAMRRMDWDLIQADHPKLVEGAMEALKEVRSIWETERGREMPPPESRAGEDRVVANLNDLVEKAIAHVSPHVSERIKIESVLFLDRPVPVFPQHIEEALVQILSRSARSMRREGRIRVVTRPRGVRAEIEISDTSGAPKQRNVPMEKDLSLAASIVRMHQGHLTVAHQGDLGASFLIDLPMT